MINPATILITAPEKRNDPTMWTHMWAVKAKNIAESLGYNVIFIEGDATTYDNVSKILTENKIRLYSHFGHGCPLSLQGQHNCLITREYTPGQLMCMAVSPHIEERQKLLRILNPLGELSCPGICKLDIDPCAPSCNYPTNVDLLKGTITLAVACHSGAQLGRCAVNYGADAYIGFSDLLMFPVDSMHSQDMFGAVQLLMFKELLMGSSPQEAEKKVSELEDYYIRGFKTVKWIALPMIWNKLHRKIWGNLNAII